MSKPLRGLESLHPAPLAAAILMISALPAETLRAEDEKSRGKTLTPVEVTSQPLDDAASPKFTAPLLDTPQTLSIIPNELFVEQGARNLTEVLRNTPGISFSAGENGFATNTNNFSLRGFDASGSVFVDGVRDSGNYGRDVFNLEQVEVAKGPAADYGRGGLGGYVNLVTKTPQQEYFVRSGVSFGADSYASDGRLRASADLNQPLSEGSALRLNVLAQDGGIAGREHATAGAYGIAPSLAFGLGSDSRLIFAAQHLKQDGRPDWGVPAALIDGTINFDPNAHAGRDAFYGLAQDHDEASSSFALLRIEHDFSDTLRLSNQLRWGENDRDAFYTIPSGYAAATQIVTGQLQGYRRENTSLSNIANLSARLATGAWEHDLALGVEFSREKSEALRYGTFNTPTPLTEPDPNRAPNARLTATQSAAVDIDTLAFYVYDTLKFSERWQLTGGLRAERYEVDLDSTDLATGEPAGAVDGYEVGETTLSGKLGLVFKPSENGSLYASVGIATLPPGSFLSNPDISRTGDNAFPGSVGQNNPEAKPQRAVNHEIGVKWNFFDDRLIASAALFNTERRSVAVAGKEPGVASSPTALRGYSQQVVHGLELGIQGRITPAWNVFAGAVFLDSERKLGDYLNEAVRTANPNDFGSFTTVDGDELAFTPKRSASVWTTYEFDNGFTVGGGIQHVGDSWAGRPDDADRIIPNGRFGELPGYTIGNLMLGWQLNEHVRLRFNIDNVTDELYAVSGNWPMTRVFLGPPRSYLLSADLRF